MVRAGSRTVSHSICLPQLSNREGGGVWIEPQDKEYAAADGGDQNKQLCPQENELHIPISDPASNSQFSQVTSPHPTRVSAQSAPSSERRASPWPWLSSLRTFPQPPPLTRLWGRSPAVWKGVSTRDRWLEADGAGAGLHLPDWATLRLTCGHSRKAQAQKRAGLCSQVWGS